MSKTSWLISEMVFSKSQGGESSRTVWIANEKSWWWRIQSKIKLRSCVDEQCLPLPSLILGLQGEALRTLHPQTWPFSHLWAVGFPLLYGKAWLANNCNHWPSIKSSIVIAEISATPLINCSLWYLQFTILWSWKGSFAAVDLPPPPNWNCFPRKAKLLSLQSLVQPYFYSPLKDLRV